ncbi:MAG: hypothetical protein K6E94_04505 [Elusimicrobiaceae bacterium]|nr:hypothetical protein [Elusimicrobiaceae bacterium]
MKKCAKLIRQVVALQEEHYQDHGQYTRYLKGLNLNGGFSTLDYSNGKYAYAITEDRTNTIVLAYRYTNSVNYDKLTCQAAQNNQQAIEACKEFLGNAKMMRQSDSCVIGSCIEYQKI